MTEEGAAQLKAYLEPGVLAVADGLEFEPVKDTYGQRNPAGSQNPQPWI